MIEPSFIVADLLRLMLLLRLSHLYSLVMILLMLLMVGMVLLHWVTTLLLFVKRVARRQSSGLLELSILTVGSACVVLTMWSTGWSHVSIIVMWIATNGTRAWSTSCTDWLSKVTELVIQGSWCLIVVLVVSTAITLLLLRLRLTWLDLLWLLVIVCRWCEHHVCIDLHRCRLLLILLLLLHGLRSGHVLLVRLIGLVLLLLSLLWLYLVRHAVSPALMLVITFLHRIAFSDSHFLLLVLLALLLLLLMLLHLNEFFLIVATHLEPQDLLVVDLVGGSFEEARVRPIRTAPVAIGAVLTGIGQRHGVLN